MNAKEFVDVVKSAAQEKTSAYDAPALVKRVDGDTLWVHIAGGVDETPVKRTINARVGDTVQVRVSGGRAYVQGNETNPPTDDRTANIARTTATSANKTATKALETAEGFERDIDNLGQRVADANERVDAIEDDIDTLDGKVDDAETAVTNLNNRVTDVEGDVTTLEGDVSTAKTNITNLQGRVSTAESDITSVEGDITNLQGRVSDAETDITTVEGNITNLQGRVTDAEDDIDDTLKGLALAQNVIGTLQWITAHSTVTTDTTPQAGTTYYIKHQDGTFEVVTDTTGKNPAQEGWYVMDESVQNYIASHIALTQDGLVVTKDNTKWKVLIKDDGVYIIDNTSGLNEVVAKYKDIIQLGQDEHSRLEITSNSLKAFNEENADFFKVDYDGLEYLETLRFQINSTHKKTTSNRYWFLSDDIECDAMANAVEYALDNSEYENGAYINTHVLYKNSAGNITIGGALSIIPDLYRYDTGVVYDVFANTNCQVYRLDGNTSSIFVVVPTIPTITLGSTSDFTVTSSVVIRANFNGNYIYFKRVMVTNYISATRRLRQQLYEPSASGNRNDTYAIIENAIHGDVTKDVTTKAPSYTLGTDIGAVKGAWSARIGRDLIAQDENQIAIGKYNNNKNGNLFEVGNGTSDSARSNAFEVADSGDVLSGGDIKDGTGNVLSDKVNVSALAPVATSGDYDDLSNTPNLATVATSGNYNDLSNKPSLATVATSGDYDDLSNKPSLPEIASGRTASITAAANSYKDLTVSFGKTFSSAPKVVCSIYSTATAGAIGSLSCSAIDVTTTGFKVRVFNAGSASRSPAVDWIAIN